MVKINNVDFIVPRHGGDTHVVLNTGSDTGTTVTLRSDSVVVADQTFPLPPLPIVSPTTVSQGSFQVTFSERRMPPPVLLPPNTPLARDSARKTIDNYIAFCDDMVDTASELFYRIFEFFAQFNAPSEEVATALLGTEDDVLNSVIDAADKVSLAYLDPRQES